MISILIRALASMRRTLKQRDGIAAVEFALIATPFMFMLFAIIESGLIFVATINLSNATMFVTRQIRDGNAMASGSKTASSGNILSLSDFKSQICKNMGLIPTDTCLSLIQVDLRTQTTFGTGQTAANPVAAGNFNNASFCFYSGQGGSIVELRAFYLWPIQTPLLLTALVNATSYSSGAAQTSGQFHVIAATEAFRVEPNSSGSNSGPGC